MKAILQETTFKQLRDLIYELCGIFIPDTKKYLMENRLYKRLEEKNLKTFEDYLYILKYNRDSEEIKKLFNSITTNETSFFREPQHFDTFMTFVFEKLMESPNKSGRKGLRIWSAACSTGEEPYTIAMILLERAFSRIRDVEVYASDISESVIDSAKLGVYSSYALRNVPDVYLKKYFSNNGQSHKLNDNVKKMVKFVNMNLIDEKKMKSMREIDVIFCRNVLIYFDEKAKQKAISFLYDSMRPGGYLFIGTSESLHNITRAFKPVTINKTLIYQKA